jgi:hypothetical protein
VPWHDCAFWREVFRALDGLLATSDLDIVLTRNVTGKPPLTGDQVIVVVINDEFGLLPPWAHQVGLVAKTMGGASRPLSVRLRSREDILYSPLTLAQEVAVQAKRVRHRARSAWKGRAGRARVLDAPLSIHLLQPGPLTPFDERPVDVSFAGSLGNSEREAARRIPSQKVRARRRLYAAVEASRRTQPHLCIRTSQLLSFHWAHDHVDSYTALMSATKVALCPRGSVWETYRWW